jgi:hypothetical protein
MPAVLPPLSSFERRLIIVRRLSIIEFLAVLYPDGFKKRRPTESAADFFKIGTWSQMCAGAIIVGAGSDHPNHVPPKAWPRRWSGGDIAW